IILDSPNIPMTLPPRQTSQKRCSGCVSQPAMIIRRSWIVPGSGKRFGRLTQPSKIVSFLAGLPTNGLYMTAKYCPAETSSVTGLAEYQGRPPTRGEEGSENSRQISQRPLEGRNFPRHRAQ